MDAAAGAVEEVARIVVYCGPVLRHPAEFMLPAVDLGGRVWLVASPVKAGLRPPPSAADRTCHPTIVCHQEFDGKERLKCTQVPMFRRPTLGRPLCSDQACIDRLAPGLGYDSRAERRAKFRCSEWRTRR